MSHDEPAQTAATCRPHVTATMGKLRRRGLVNYEHGKPLTVDTEASNIYLTGISSS